MLFVLSCLIYFIQPGRVDLPHQSCEQDAISPPVLFARRFILMNDRPIASVIWGTPLGHEACDAARNFQRTAKIYERLVNQLPERKAGIIQSDSGLKRILRAAMAQEKAEDELHRILTELVPPAQQHHFAPLFDVFVDMIVERNFPIPDVLHSIWNEPRLLNNQGVWVALFADAERVFDLKRCQFVPYNPDIHPAPLITLHKQVAYAMRNVLAPLNQHVRQLPALNAAQYILQHYEAYRDAADAAGQKERAMWNSVKGIKRAARSA